RLHARYVAPLEEDPALARLQELGQQVEERALAGAVRPDQGVDRALAHLEVDAVDGDAAAERTRQAAGFADSHFVSHISSRPVVSPGTGRQFFVPGSLTARNHIKSNNASCVFQLR